MPRLIMFDIDGTLTETNDVDTRCYVQAMSEHLGVAIDSEWSRYRHVTDSGIAAELLERHGRPPGELDQVRARFVALITDALRATPDACTQIPGAADFLRSLRRMPDIVIGLATGAWSESARAKLHHARLDVEDLAFASADDAESRIDIMTACRDRAASSGMPISETIYVGDGIWDAQASHALGWRFIGIAQGIRAEQLRQAGASKVFADFRNPQTVLSGLGVR
ncbi:MAG: Haloacid dehalogenase domain protein hydrolase [Phycisphaerales bacterium]|nr:Haloacid dehalogenase domain protein hydrolase [Phycisphaerales bacterium]